MRWKTYGNFKNGEKRTTKYFAFFPTKLDDGTTVWLESYWVRESFDNGELTTGFPFWHTWEKTASDPNRPDTGSVTR